MIGLTDQAAVPLRGNPVNWSMRLNPYQPLQLTGDGSPRNVRMSRVGRLLLHGVSSMDAQEFSILSLHNRWGSWPGRELCNALSRM
jgi:hypothetical protein